MYTHKITYTHQVRYLGDVQSSFMVVADDIDMHLACFAKRRDVSSVLVEPLGA